MSPKANHHTRKLRQKQTAEVFTPPKLVNQMLNKLPREVWKKGKTFCDPACGNGNFLIWVLLRKLSRGHKPLEALQCVYGADIMVDNIRECRMRLLKVITLMGEEITEEHIKAVMKNIVWINQHKYPGGSLEYDFEFNNSVNNKDVERWMEWIHQDNALEQVELPVSEEIFSSPPILTISRKCKNSHLSD